MRLLNTLLDGGRFLVIHSDDAATLRQINAVLNWFEESVK